MKTNRIVMLVAAAAMLFAACGKDDENAEIAANTMLLNGKVYQLNSRYQLDVGRSYVDATTVDLDAQGEPLYTIIADVEVNTLNRTFTLGEQPAEGEMYYFNIHDMEWNFTCGPEQFASGTVTISKTDNLFSYKVDGKTREGERTGFHISVPASEWQQMEWK